MELLSIDEATRIALQSAADLAKQLITLGTGLLALSIAFVKDILKGLPPGRTGWLKAAWVCLGVCILSGVWALAALTGTVAPVNFPTEPEVVRLGFSVRLPAAIQEISFVLAVLFLLVFGWRALRPAEAADRTGGGS